MREPPRDPNEPVIDRGVVQRILTQAALVGGIGLVAYTAGLSWLGLDIVGAQTMTFIAMSAGQVLTVFNARSDRGSGFRGATRNPWLWAALGVTAALEAGALFIRPLADLIGLTTMPAQGWLIAGVLALVPLALTQAVRMVRARS